MLEANLNTHHIDYERIGNERFIDLVVVCCECHIDFHRFIRKMEKKGFKRTRVMNRMRPYIIRRMLEIHNLYGKTELGMDLIDLKKYQDDKQR